MNYFYSWGVSKITNLTITHGIVTTIATIQTIYFTGTILSKAFREVRQMPALFTILACGIFSGTFTDADSIISSAIQNTINQNHFTAVSTSHIQIRYPEFILIWLYRYLTGRTLDRHTHKIQRTYKHSVKGSKSLDWHVIKVSIDIKTENLILCTFRNCNVVLFERHMQPSHEPPTFDATQNTAPHYETPA